MCSSIKYLIFINSDQMASLCWLRLYCPIKFFRAAFLIFVIFIGHLIWPASLKHLAAHKYLYRNLLKLLYFWQIRYFTRAKSFLLLAFILAFEGPFRFFFLWSLFELEFIAIGQSSLLFCFGFHFLHSVFHSHFSICPKFSLLFFRLPVLLKIFFHLFNPNSNFSFTIYGYLLL